MKPLDVSSLFLARALRHLGCTTAQRGTKEQKQHLTGKVIGRLLMEAIVHQGTLTIDTRHRLLAQGEEEMRRRRRDGRKGRGRRRRRVADLKGQEEEEEKTRET